jgi:cobalt-zinc-cadmium efflux system outer membrane protein
MKRPFLQLRLLWPLLAFVPASYLCAQTTLTWQQLKDKFEAANPTMQAAHQGIDEARAAEITAYLRPNPEFGIAVDGTQLTPYNGIYRPFAGTQFSPSISYLHERDQKRELRRDTAKLNTAISESTAFDQERGLLFTLRGAYVQVLKSKALLDNAKENLEYWDHELDISRTRYQAGDLALVDLNRLELQRPQFEADYENAVVSLRTAKIQLLMLLNDRTPIDQFDVTGAFDFSEDLRPLEQYRKLALDARPDLKAAMQGVELAKATHQLAVANGSTDPTFSGWWTHNPSFNNPYDFNTVGASISIPLRMFDRNQGEKAKTQIDIGRNERLVAGTEALVFSDVDSAYWTLIEAVNLLKPYKTKYLALATDVRDRMSFSYQNGGASLIEFLDAEKSYRDTRSAYVNLIGSYMTAGAQLNMAAGREVLP